MVYKTEILETDFTFVSSLNVNIYDCDEEDFIKATYRVYYDVQKPSHVNVRIMLEK